MKGRFGTIILVSLFLIFPMFSGGQEGDNTGNVKGFVYQEDGKQFQPKVVVELQRIERDKEKDEIKYFEKYNSNETDETGEYMVSKLPVGEYLGKVLKDGKVVKTRRVDFFIQTYKGKTNNLSFFLKKK